MPVHVSGIVCPYMCPCNGCLYMCHCNVCPYIRLVNVCPYMRPGNGYMCLYMRPGNGNVCLYMCPCNVSLYICPGNGCPYMRPGNMCLYMCPVTVRFTHYQAHVLQFYHENLFIFVYIKDGNKSVKTVFKTLVKDKSLYSCFRKDNTPT